MSGQRIAVIGSREYPDLSEVRRYVHSLPESSVIVTGGWDATREWNGAPWAQARPTRGVDCAAYLAALERPDLIPVLVIANGKRGQGAGLYRNHTIVDVAECVRSFWNGRSSGTAFTERLAREAGKLLP